MLKHPCYKIIYSVGFFSSYLWVTFAFLSASYPEFFSHIFIQKHFVNFFIFSCFIFFIYTLALGDLNNILPSTIWLLFEISPHIWGKYRPLLTGCINKVNIYLFPRKYVFSLCLFFLNMCKILPSSVVLGWMPGFPS